MKPVYCVSKLLTLTVTTALEIRKLDINVSQKAFTDKKHSKNNIII